MSPPGAVLKIGDKVRVIGTPENLPENDMQTRQIFELCPGRAPAIEGFEGDLVEPCVGDVVGEPDFRHSLYIEPELIKVIETAS